MLLKVTVYQPNPELWIEYKWRKKLLCMTWSERYYGRRTMQFLEQVEGKLNKTKAGQKEVGKVLCMKQKVNNRIPWKLIRSILLSGWRHL